MESILSNLRWIYLPSDHLGEDWPEKSALIDERLAEWSMDLSEESVFLLYDRAPGAVLEGEGKCLVARPVVGPKRAPEAPFGLLDWSQARVSREPLTADSWPQLHQQAFEAWQELHRKGARIAAPFMIRLARRLIPELSLKAEVIFSEDSLSGRGTSL